MSGIKLVTAPVLEPLSLDEVKSHCRVTHTAEDYDLFAYRQAAREFVEDETNRALLTSTWDLYLDAFPCGDHIKIPKGNLQSITSLTYIDSAAASTVWPSSNYIVDTASEPARLVLAYGKSWPAATLQPANGVVIRFVAGWTSALDVPWRFKAAMKLLIGHWYVHREAVTLGNAAASVSEDLKLGVDRLLGQLRIWAF
jgi:uncharacterized phiE125 gp8 family phage protein